MDTYLLHRTGTAALRIESDRIGRAETQGLGGKEAHRWYIVEVYRLGDGRLAWHVGFRTVWSGEVDHDWAGVVAGPAELIAALSAPHVPERVGFPASPHYAERQAALLADLERHHAHAVSTVLDDADVVAEPPAADDEYAVFDAAALLDFVRAEIGGLGLTEAEASAIADANNGALLMSPACWLAVAANVADADRLSGLGERWGVDAADLARRIHAAGRGVQFALAWASARFWRRTDLPTPQALIESGFVSP